MPFDIPPQQPPPHNTEAEQAILGCLFTRNEVYDDIAHIIKPEHFYVPVHGEIYAAIEKTIQAHKTASPVTLKGQFANHPDLKETGGAMYLAELAGSIVSAINTKDYAETIKELYTRRILIDGLQDVIARAYNAPELDRGSVLESANKCVNALVDDMPNRTYVIRDAMSEAIQFMQDIKSGKIKPIKTGIPPLDQALGGLYGGDLYVIAGRPGMGKTALALNIADNVAREKNGISSTVFSLEMRADQLSMRCFARETGISTQRQRSTDPLSDYEWDQLAQTRQYYNDIPLYIEDCAATTLRMIQSIARKTRRMRGRFLLVIDYLQLITAETNRDKGVVYQVADITRGLKQLAKELDIPVIVLSQLSREVERREDKRPLKSDLRDSGAIEQDADCIIFPYRHEYYLARQEPVRRAGEGQAQYDSNVLEWQSQLMNARGKAELIIAKARFGKECSVPTSFDGERQLFHCGT